MFEALRSLPAARLREMATAFREGMLGLPCSELALQRTFPADQVPALKADIEQLGKVSFQPTQVSVLLELLAETAERETVSAERLSLVWTGPEAPGIVSRDTRAVVEELFRSARRSVLIAGYVIYQGQEVFKELARRMEEVPDLTVKMFLNVSRSYNDTRAEQAIFGEFRDRFRREWPGSCFPEVFYDPRGLELDPKVRASLHAKVVIVDGKRAFVSSANFTEAAQVKNIEVGILVRDALFAGKLDQHFVGLAANNTLHKLALS